MTDSGLGDKWYYDCDRCDYDGKGYLLRPTAEPSKSVLCPECHEPTLVREAPADQE